MGPQPNSCGNVPATCEPSRKWTRRLQWGHSQTAVETRVAFIEGLALLETLQWGHSQTAVETTLAVSNKGGRVDASMGPQPNSCGNGIALITGSLFATLQWGHSQTAVETHARGSAHRADNPCFNGATAKQLWKPPGPCLVIRWQDASMGPQPNSCGNPEISIAALSTAKASMGPQPNSCGNRSGVQTHCLGCPSFNGATAKQLWKRVYDARPFEFGSGLQWGHSQTAVETDRGNGAWTSLKSLQWGHSQTAVET